jgi:hypothetical protein
VLTEDEVGPVMRKLQERGIEITALHNHLISESPHVLYMHIEGHGEAVRMARAIHEAVGLTKTPLSHSPDDYGRLTKIEHSLFYEKGTLSYVVTRGTFLLSVDIVWQVP